MFIKNKKINKVKPRVKTAHQKAKDFIQAAAQFEKDANERMKKSERRAWIISMIAAGCALSSMVAVMMLSPLKSVEPFIVRVDNNTGLTDTISTLKNQTVENDEVINKYWLAQYVKYREGYDWYTIQDTYDATILLSSSKVQSEFNALYQAEQAPHKVFKNNFKTVININAISFVGKMAQVRFEKKLVATDPKAGDVDTSAQNMIATIAFKYENPPLNEADRRVNPLGFQVLSYRVDQERE